MWPRGLGRAHGVREIAGSNPATPIMIKKKIKFSKINPVRYEFFVLIGFTIAVGAFGKVLGIWNFSSDWFWFFVGIGLIIEGIIALFKQRRFDRKYKIVEKSQD